MLISIFKHDNKIRKDWDIHSYTYVNEYGELMLNEECCKDLKIPKSLRPFTLYPPTKNTELFCYFGEQFSIKLFRFLGCYTENTEMPDLIEMYSRYLQDNLYLYNTLVYEIDQREFDYGENDEPFTLNKREFNIIKRRQELMIENAARFDTKKYVWADQLNNEYKQKQLEDYIQYYIEMDIEPPFTG